MIETQYNGDLLARFRQAEQRFEQRDRRHAEVSAARRGDVQQLLPGMFPKNFPRQITANIINTAAQDLGEILGELPDILCRPQNPTAQKSVNAAAKRTKIAIDYVRSSRLQSQMYSGCDQLLTFGALPLIVEPDFKESKPRLRVDSPVGAYYELDFLGRTAIYFKKWYEPVSALCAKFPDLAHSLKYGRAMSGAYDLGHSSDSVNLCVVKYFGPDKFCVFTPDRDGLVLSESPNHMGEVPVFIAERPKWDVEVRGAYDEAVWIQVARARMALFTMEATDKAINSPIRVPKDVNRFNYGPNALIHTDSQVADAVSRVRLDVPPAAFAQNEILQQEERLSARYPEGRSGSIDASVITGQGVKELLGTMDSQVKTIQDLLGHTLSDALGFAMKMDETFWPNVEKTIKGDADGAPFVERYEPVKAIDGNYEVTTTYGLAYGMDHQRGLVFALQLRGDRIVDRGSVRQQFAKAFGVDAEQIERLVDIEEIDDALKQGVFQLASAVGNPELAAMGVDPRKVVQQLSVIQRERAKGKPLADAIDKALQPTEEEKRAAEQQQAAIANDPMAAAAQEMGAAGGGPQGSPGGNGGLQQLLAGLTTAGNPQLSARVSRQLPA